MGVENLGNTILRLRREKGVTQEILADFVGVTKTSVSKWETGSTLPDIQMLPLLAAFFGVTVDELIGYIPMLSREQIRFHYHRLAERFAVGTFGEVLQECREIVRKYYSCYPFLLQMTILLLNHANRATEKSDREQIFQLAFQLCDHILAECKDVGICRKIVSVKACLHLMEGRADLVLEELEGESLRPDGIEDMGGLLTMAYLMAGDLEQAAKAAQVGMYGSLKGMMSYGVYLLQARGGDIDYGNLILQRLDRVIETFSLVGLDPNAVAAYEYQAALYLAGSGGCGDGLEEKIFLRLEHYAAACGQLFADGIKQHGDSFFDSLDPWLEESELGTEGLRSERSVRESVLEGLRNPVFSGLKDQERLRRLELEITERTGGK